MHSYRTLAKSYGGPGDGKGNHFCSLLKTLQLESNNMGKRWNSFKNLDKWISHYWARASAAWLTFAAFPGGHEISVKSHTSSFRRRGNDKLFKDCSPLFSSSFLLASVKERVRLLVSLPACVVGQDLCSSLHWIGRSALAPFPSLFVLDFFHCFFISNCILVSSGAGAWVNWFILLMVCLISAIILFVAT